MILVVGWIAVVHTLFVFAWSLDKLRTLAGAESAGWPRFGAWLAMLVTGVVVWFVLLALVLGGSGISRLLAK